MSGSKSDNDDDNNNATGATSRLSKPLRVEKIYPNSKYHHGVRVDKETMNSLNLSESQIVEIISSKRRTFAKCYLLFLNDDSKGVLRANELFRDNAGVVVGDTVVIRKVENVVPAKKVAIAPIIQSMLKLATMVDNDTITSELANNPIVVGDAIAVPNALVDPYTYTRIVFRVIEIQTASTTASISNSADAIIPSSKNEAAAVIKGDTDFVITPNPILIYQLKEKIAAYYDDDNSIKNNQSLNFIRGRVELEIEATGTVDQGTKLLTLNLLLSVRTFSVADRRFTVMLSRNQNFDTAAQGYIARAKEIVKEANRGLPILDIPSKLDMVQVTDVMDRVIALENSIFKSWSELDYY